MADEPTVFGPKATEQIAKTVREVSRRMMLPRGERARWQWHGGGGAVETAYATITESGKDDMFQEVTLKRSAAPDTFTEATCGGVTFDDMQFTLAETIATGVTVLVPAGYKAGEAMLVKFSVAPSAHEWDGWVVVAGPTMRCAAQIPTAVECCPTTQLIKFTEYNNIWYFGGADAPTEDPCP